MELKEFFGLYKRTAIAFSGGVDSSYLLKAAVDAGADVRAYYVRSQFQPEFELRDARRIAEFCGADMKVIELDVLSDETVTSNPPDRCYYCKMRILSAVIRQAADDGCDVIADGTNASDDAGDRPGHRALKEFGIRSPLRECGITKPEVRRLAHEAGLPVWNKPAYACLATRIPYGEEITADKLIKTEKAETALFDMGFRDFRVRMRGNNALIQVRSEQYNDALDRKNEIIEAIGPMYDDIVIDEKTR